MKNTVKFSLIAVCLCFLTACEKDPNIQSTEEEKESIQITDIEYTECNSANLKNESEDIVLEYKNGYLYVTHNNAMVNCAFTKIDVSFSIQDNIIEIIEQEDATDANCLCSTNISYKIGAIDSGEYTIIIKLRDRIVYEQPTEIWEWIATYTGFRGTIEPPEFKSLINIYTNGQGSLAQYQVYVNDLLFSSGEIDYSQFPTSLEGVVTTLELPHDICQSCQRMIHPMNTSLEQSQDTIAFSDGTVDCYYYFYTKTN